MLLREPKKTIKIKYDTTAPSYEKLYGEEQRRKYAIAFKMLREAHIEIASSQILDAGCGTGLLMREISREAQHVVGVDFSIGMIREAKKRIDSNIWERAKCSLVLADIEYLPFRENTFNLAFSITVLQNIQNQKQVLYELFRVLKKNGRVVVSILKRTGEKEQVINLVSQLKNVEIHAILEEDKDLILLLHGKAQQSSEKSNSTH